MEATVTEAQRAAPPPRMRELYASEVAPSLTKRFGYSNPMQVPRLVKVTLNMGIGEAKTSTSVLEAATEQLAVIAGQHPNVRRARKSIANFKIREGMPVGVSVTLRSARMWEFVDRLVRSRFRGSATSAGSTRAPSTAAATTRSESASS